MGGMIGKPHTVEDNCLFLDGKLDGPIYRVFSSSRLFEMFDTSKLSLLRPKMWEDPFENFLYQIPCVDLTTGASVSVENLRRKLYGQCWSFEKESDAMWRIYSPTKDAIKVSSTPRRLIRAIYDAKHQFASLMYFIGAVRYAEENDFVTFFSNPDSMLTCITDTSARCPVELLLWKRREFEHEKEVRLIFQNTHDLPDDIVHFDIDPFTLFDEVVFDPRMPKPIAAAFSAKLRTYGFKGTIDQSKLYQLPAFPKAIVI